MSITPTPRRGEIWLVDFQKSVGAEIQKLRPAVVMSLDTLGRLPLRVVVPVTDWKPLYVGYVWFVYIPASTTNGLNKDSGADAFQVKSVSEKRFAQSLSHKSVYAGSGVGRIANPSYGFEDGHRGLPPCGTDSQRLGLVSAHELAAIATAVAVVVGKP